MFGEEWKRGKIRFITKICLCPAVSHNANPRPHGGGPKTNACLLNRRLFQNVLSVSGGQYDVDEYWAHNPKMKSITTCTSRPAVVRFLS